MPAGDESLWTSPPFEPTERDGAIFGRGASDSKANVMAHVGALRAWGGKPPVGIKLVIEGQEEVGSALNTYPPTNPDAFRADAMLIADMGSVRPGVPTLTVALRGTAQVTIEVTTLAGAKHSGQYGGAAPDALIVLIHALASLHDDHGNVAVEGLRREEWTGASYSEEEFRELAEVEPGLPLFGTRRARRAALVGAGDHRHRHRRALGRRARSTPSSPHARAKLNVRVHPEQDAAEAQDAVIEHLEGLQPFGIELEVHARADRERLRGRDRRPGLHGRARRAGDGLGSEPVTVASGGSIPLVGALQRGGAGRRDPALRRH